MTIFEDDTINDDFEVEITDLDPENETDRISSAIVALRSRISFKERADGSAINRPPTIASPDDDFELEITDLPASDEDSRFPAAIAALRSYITFKPGSQEANDEIVNDDFEVEITDLPLNDDESIGARFIAPQTGTGRDKSGPYGWYARLPRKTRLLRQALVGIGILLMLGVVLESIPSSREALLSLFPRSIPTPTPATVSRDSEGFGGFHSSSLITTGNISISSTPIAGVPVIPWNPNSPVASVLNAAPETCPSGSVPQDPDSIDYPYNNRIGGPPLWILGFQGYPANLTGFTRATPQQYGWVHQVVVLLVGGSDDPVMLQGARLDDGTPILFRDPYAGQSPSTFLTVNPGVSSVSDPDGAMEGGVAPISLYIPSAGCYYLKASWVGGSWEVIFSAGA